MNGEMFCMWLFELNFRWGKTMKNKRVRKYVTWAAVIFLLLVILLTLAEEIKKSKQQISGGQQEAAAQTGSKDDNVRSSMDCELLTKTPDFLLERAESPYSGNRYDYYAKEAVRVQSSNEEFEKYAKSLLDFCEFAEPGCYHYDNNGQLISIYATGHGARFWLYRTECFPLVVTDAVYYRDYAEEGMYGDLPVYYDATGKYALYEQKAEDKVIAKFLGLAYDANSDGSASMNSDGSFDYSELLEIPEEVDPYREGSKSLAYSNGRLPDSGRIYSHKYQITESLEYAVNSEFRAYSYTLLSDTQTWNIVISSGEKESASHGIHIRDLRVDDDADLFIIVEETDDEEVDEAVDGPVYPQCILSISPITGEDIQNVFVTTVDGEILGYLR